LRQKVNHETHETHEKKFDANFTNQHEFILSRFVQFVSPNFRVEDFIFAKPEIIA